MRVESSRCPVSRQNRGCEDLIRTVLKGTCWVSRVRRQKRTAKQGRRRVRIGAPDASLTGLAGLVAVDELTERLGMVAELDAGIGPIKQRARGLSGGQLLLGMAPRSWPGRTAWPGWTGSGRMPAAPC